MGKMIAIILEMWQEKEVKEAKVHSISFIYTYLQISL